MRLEDATNVVHPYRLVIGLEKSNQDIRCVAIGLLARAESQRDSAISIGFEAGMVSQR